MKYQTDPTLIMIINKSPPWHKLNLQYNLVLKIYKQKQISILADVLHIAIVYYCMVLLFDKFLPF